MKCRKQAYRTRKANAFKNGDAEIAETMSYRPDRTYGVDLPAQNQIGKCTPTRIRLKSVHVRQRDQFFVKCFQRAVWSSMLSPQRWQKPVKFDTMADAG